jgi:hypothetical protein
VPALKEAIFQMGLSDRRAGLRLWFPSAAYVHPCFPYRANPHLYLCHADNDMPGPAILSKIAHTCEASHGQVLEKVHLAFGQSEQCSPAFYGPLNRYLS